MLSLARWRLARHKIRTSPVSPAPWLHTPWDRSRRALTHDGVSATSPRGFPLDRHAVWCPTERLKSAIVANSPQQRPVRVPRKSLGVGFSFPVLRRTLCSDFLPNIWWLFFTGNSCLLLRKLQTFVSLLEIPAVLSLPLRCQLTTAQSAVSVLLSR